MSVPLYPMSVQMVIVSTMTAHILVHVTMGMKSTATTCIGNNLVNNLLYAYLAIRYC